MKRLLEPLAVAAAGIALLAARPPWTPSIEDRVVVVCWAAALGLWAWLLAVGTVHAWATRTGRRRWRRLSGALLPAAVRRRVEQVALAGMLVVPVAACGTGAEQPAAPVLVLEETITLDPVAPSGGAPTTTTPDATEPAPAASTTVVDVDPGREPAPSPEPDPGPTAPPANPAPDAGGSAEPAPSPSDPTTAPSAPTAPAPPEAPPVPPAEPAVTVDPQLDAADPVDDPAFRIPAEAGTRVVLRGDNLWSIAADHLASVTGRTASVDEVGRYWSALVAENGSTLASGNPDVIYAGEVIRLPAVP